MKREVRIVGWSLIIIVIVAVAVCIILYCIAVSYLICAWAMQLTII